MLGEQVLMIWVFPVEYFGSINRVEGELHYIPN